MAEQPESESAGTATTGRIERRHLLAALGSAGLLSTTGCLGVLGDRSETGPRPADPTATASPDGEEPTTAGEGATYDIDWTVQGATTEVAENELLLDAALAADLDVPYQCQQGICGQCTSKVPGPGTEYVEHDGNQYLSDAQVEAGYVLTCVAFPLQDFEIETGMQDEADSFSPGETTDEPEQTTAGEVATYDVDWTVQGATTEVSADELLLDAALDADLDVPYLCEHGVCGECTSKVPGNGSEYVEHDGNQYLSDAQIEAGYVLTCVGYPLQDFEIETGVKDEADAV
jgi:ferredoxin